MNEGHSPNRSPAKAHGKTLSPALLSWTFAAFLPLLGTAALVHADRAFGQDGLFGPAVEQAVLQPSPQQPLSPGDASEDVAAGTTILGQEIAGGVASWYGAQFDGKRTASGERFDADELTAAHRTLPFGSRVRVKCARTGKSVVVRINDRGPFGHGRVIDLSQAAAKQIGLTQTGSGRVELALLDR